jgi:hypothetical protein
VQAGSDWRESWRQTMQGVWVESWARTKVVAVTARSARALKNFMVCIVWVMWIEGIGRSM